MMLFKSKRNRAIAQILFWASLMVVMNLMFNGIGAPSHFYYRNYIHIFSATVIVLLNVYVLIPRYFAQKRYRAYALTVVLSIAAITVMAVFIESNLFQERTRGFQRGNETLELRPGGPPHLEGREGEAMRKPSPGPIDPQYFITFIIYSAVFLTGTVMESIQLYSKQEYLASLAQNEKLETELKFLKSQINPHFLFNALNNVYTLSLIQSEQTPEVVMKLSEMLRYMLYGSNQDRASLEQEINYIQNYVDLQQLKDDAPLDVEMAINTHNDKVRIAPMILIPFVENAFKHSKIEDTDNGWIKIGLWEEGNNFTFSVSNSLVKKDFTKDPTHGIGLANVQRRLELEYPGRHHLEITQDDGQFNIKLSIQLP